MICEFPNKHESQSDEKSGESDALESQGRGNDHSPPPSAAGRSGHMSSSRRALAPEYDAVVFAQARGYLDPASAGGLKKWTD